MEIPKELLELGEAIIDSYIVVDLQRNIVHCNAAFRAMLPRAVARNLIGKRCADVLKLEICQESCAAHQCWASDRAIRLDEISGQVDADTELRFIISTIPLRNDEGQVIGALEIHRNVTDEAAVQKKYQKHIETASAEIDELHTVLATRSRQLLDVARQLDETERALLAAKTEYF